MPQVADKTRPAGRSGVAAQETTVPPVLFGVTGAINAFCVKLNGLPTYTKAGGWSFTWMLIVAEESPPLLVPVIT